MQLTPTATRRCRFDSCIRCTASHCNTLQHTATYCNIPQHTATYCDILTATHCSTLQRCHFDTRHKYICLFHCTLGQKEYCANEYILGAQSLSQECQKRFFGRKLLCMKAPCLFAKEQYMIYYICKRAVHNTLYQSATNTIADKLMYVLFLADINIGGDGVFQRTRCQYVC